MRVSANVRVCVSECTCALEKRGQSKPDEKDEKDDDDDDDDNDMMMLMIMMLMIMMIKDNHG